MIRMADSQAREDIAPMEWVVGAAIPSPSDYRNYFKGIAPSTVSPKGVPEEPDSISRASNKLIAESLLSRSRRRWAEAPNRDNSSVVLNARPESFPDALTLLECQLRELPERVRRSEVFDCDIAPRSLRHAHTFLRRLFLLLHLKGKPWYEPHLGSEGHGDVEFSWSYGGKSLSFSITDSAVYYLKVWGPQIDTEMEDGVVSDDSDLIALWHWMTN